MEYVTKNDELMHYGVPGMRRGHRKASYETQKTAYKQAKKDLRTANRELIKSSYTAIGVKGLNKYNKAESKANRAELNKINAKANYKAAKSKNSKKAEFNTYRNEMYKSGIVGSSNDRLSGNRSTRIYNELRRKKGKEYADRVQKSVQNRAVATFVGSAVVSLGSVAVSAYLYDHR